MIAPYDGIAPHPTSFVLESTKLSCCETTSVHDARDKPALIFGYELISCEIRYHFLCKFLPSYSHKMSFTNVPVLDLSLARSADTKPDFLDQLRHALLEVGFLYLKNIGIPQELIENVVEEGVKFFDIPMEEK